MASVLGWFSAGGGRSFPVSVGSGECRAQRGVHRLGAVVRSHLSRDIGLGEPKRGIGQSNRAAKTPHAIPIAIDPHAQAPRCLFLEEQVDRRQLTGGHSIDDLSRDEPHAVQLAAVHKASVEAGDRVRGAVAVDGRYLGGTPCPTVHHRQVE